MNNIGKISSLSKSFDKGKTFAVFDLNFELPEGKMVGLVGPDGAGKTTLIRLMAGLLKPTTGTITLLGCDTIQNAEALHEQIGYMPQKFGLYEDLTVQENLDLYADLQAVPKTEQLEVFKRVLEFTGLKPFTERLAGKLSGGMKQKLGLACVLLRKPKILLLDEPSVGVDPKSRRELWKMVTELLNEQITVVWSTAYLDEAEKCHTVLLMNEGKLLYQGDPKLLTSQLEGRTYLLKSFQGSKRETLEKIQMEPNVVDASLQGSSIRLVVRGDISHIQLPLLPVTPRFEDAFLDILGGASCKISPLGSAMQKVEENHEMIIAKNLTKKFGDFVAVRDVTFEIKKGEIFGLLGPNGAGKTTTFKMLCGLLSPSSGSATVSGVDLQEAPSIARSRIGYMAQKFSLYGNMTVIQNLRFFAGLYAVKNDRIMIQKMIDIFELEHYINIEAGMLPLGFKQRLALASCLMHQPKILFLDEPTSGVDPATRREFWNHINSLVDKGVTIMVTTHFMDEAEYCDRIALVSNGQLITIGSPDELKEMAGVNTLEDAFIQLSEAKP